MVTEEKREPNSEMAKLYEESISDFQEGQIVKGKIVQIGEKEILIDIGYKSEGIIYKSEVPGAATVTMSALVDAPLT